ncbi:nuclease-related domain-containing protein [Bacillus cereus]|uniref:nuclease-related domain-containing protein n=1 Tax=Bacillus cereus group TaxID=86661 RepID=UPI001F587309|nr:nuclease-related domain-containing protein [Bacillus cereus]MDZ4652112.1 nuclease-related domain-containing protein [Bacillus cereus]
MANVYPDSPEPRTIGEKQIIELLKSKLDESWALFYEPLIVNRQPDLLLFSDQYGILVLEIKDYRRSTIVTVSPNDWMIKGERGRVHLSSPYKQARNYTFTVMDFLAKEPLLTNRPVFSGKLKIPVVPICVFTNLTKQDIVSLGIDRVIPLESIVTSEFLKLDEEHLQEKLHNIFSAYFLIPQLTEIEATLIKSKLYPKLKITTQEQVKKIVESSVQVTGNNESAAQLFSFLSWDDKKENAYENLSNINDLLFNVNEFYSIIDELLFVSTEIRHLYNAGEKELNDIAIVFYKNRRILKEELVKQVIEVLSEMGIPVEEGIAKTRKVNLLSFEQLERSKAIFKYVFIIDFNQIRGKETYDKILVTIKETSIRKFTYISFNNLTNLTEKISSSWNLLLN